MWPGYTQLKLKSGASFPKLYRSATDTYQLLRLLYKHRQAIVNGYLREKAQVQAPVHRSTPIDDKTLSETVQARYFEDDMLQNHP